MAAVLVTDLVASTRLTQSMGTTSFQQVQQSLEDETLRCCLARGGAVPTDVNSGDGSTATFEFATDAVGAAQEIMLAAERIGLQVRAAVHGCSAPPRRTDLADADRVCGQAAPGEIMLSEPVISAVATLSTWVTPAGHAETSDGTTRLFRLRTIVPDDVLDGH